jgi:outer membrane cobalamin receptor
MDDSTISLYINADHTLVNDHLVLSVGLRNDNYDSWGSQTTGNIGAAWNFTPALAFLPTTAPAIKRQLCHSYSTKVTARMR